MTGTNADRGSTPSAAPGRTGVVRIGPSWLQVVALVLAVGFLVGAGVHWLENREPSPNASDIGFVDDMTKHHQQAISMSFTYFKHATANQLPTTATEIIGSQSGDLRIMSGLRNDWPESSGESETVMAWMGMARPLKEMPGFASDAELAKLDTARGLELDDLFTTLMIRHHLGGIHMAEAAVRQANVPEVRGLAAGIVSLQHQEIDELNQWRRSAGLADVTSVPGI